MVFEPNLSKAFALRTLPTALRILEDTDTPRALAIHLLAKDGQDSSWDQVFSMPISPLHYCESDYDKFDRDYTATKLLQKIPNFLERDLVGCALDAFKAAEKQCGDTNRALLDNSLSFRLRELGAPDLTTIKHKMSKILGRAPSLQAVVTCGGWGPGSSYTLSRRKASPEFKCEYERTVTLKLANAVSQVDMPLWFYQEPWQLVPGNLITTTPKNAKTDRTIAIEPGINSWCQKGIGYFIRKRLLKWGINLNDQRFNQDGALRALMDALVTLDLKAASDSISLELVCQILPNDWLELILLCRSERGSFNKRNDSVKEWFEYEKVSSMGNGFTFELESAIFFAILLACGVSTCEAYVYGDDIIIPRNKAKITIDTLEALGFSVNNEKSFTEGLFYESCGVHSFNGVDVTPVQIKDCLHGPKDIIILANKLRLFAHRRNSYHGCDRRYLPCYRMCIDWLPPAIRTRARGPVGSALTLFVNQNEALCSRYSAKRGRFRIGYLKPVLKQTVADFTSLLQYRLFEMESKIDMLLHQQDDLRLPFEFRLSERPCDLPTTLVDPLDTAMRAKKRRLNVVRSELRKFTVSDTYVEQWYTLGAWK